MKYQPFWYSTQSPAHSFPELVDDQQADVVIVGGGYTGLWTAYYLKQMKPDWRVIVLEKNTLGSGASGRNGGWFMGRFNLLESYFKNNDVSYNQQLSSVAKSSLDELLRLTAAGELDADVHHGGTIDMAARYPEQQKYIEDSIRSLHQMGYTEDDYRLLSASEAKQRVSMDKVMGAIYSPHCAVVNPWKLVQGLIQLCVKAGVELYENTAVTSYESRVVSTQRASVKAGFVVLAQEGFRESCAPTSKYLLPVQSMMLATAPLTEQQWAKVGLAQRETYCDVSCVTTYGQRTADGRLMFGARGSYIFGGKAKADFSDSGDTFVQLRKLMTQCFPQLIDQEVEYGWGGTLALAFRSSPKVIFDDRSGTVVVGGYAGEGVGASNLFGRTAAELMCGAESERTAMPWVTRNSLPKGFHRWVPEPFRYLTYRTYRALNDCEDQLLYHRRSKALRWPVGVLASGIRHVVDS